MTAGKKHRKDGSKNTILNKTTNETTTEDSTYAGGIRIRQFVILHPPSGRMRHSQRQQNHINRIQRNPRWRRQLL